MKLRRGRRHRRYPHLTPADVVALDLLEPDAARAHERALRDEWDEEQAYRGLCSPEADFGPAALEQLHARRASRFSHGAGGGRRRGVPPRDDDG